MKDRVTKKECCVPPPHLKDALALKCWEVMLMPDVRPANPLYSKAIYVNSWYFKLNKNPEYIIDGKTAYIFEKDKVTGKDWTEGSALMDDKTGLGMFDMNRSDGRRLYYSLQKCKIKSVRSKGDNKIIFVEIDNSKNEKKGKNCLSTFK